MKRNRILAGMIVLIVCVLAIAGTNVANADTIEYPNGTYTGETLNGKRHG